MLRQQRRYLRMASVENTEVIACRLCGRVGGAWLIDGKYVETGHMCMPEGQEALVPEIRTAGSRR